MPLSITRRLGRFRTFVGGECWSAHNAKGGASGAVSATARLAWSGQLSAAAEMLAQVQRWRNPPFTRSFTPCNQEITMAGKQIGKSHEGKHSDPAKGQKGVTKHRWV